MVETNLQTAREQEGHLRQEAAEARAKVQAEAAMCDEAAHIVAETLMQEQLEREAIAAQFRTHEDHIRQEREAEEDRAKAQAEAAAHEEAARAVAEKLMYEQRERDAIAAQEDCIRQEREAEEGRAKAQAEAAAREEAARAVAEKLMQEQRERDVIAAQFRAQEDRIRQEREAEEVQAKVQAQAAACEEAARAVAEKLMQEQRERDAIAAQFRAQEDHIRQEREAEEARAKVQTEAAAGSLKKRPRISDSSDGEDGTKPAGGDDEGDGKELTEADLRRREGEHCS